MLTSCGMSHCMQMVVNANLARGAGGRKLPQAQAAALPVVAQLLPMLSHRIASVPHPRAVSMAKQRVLVKRLDAVQVKEQGGS